MSTATTANPVKSPEEALAAALPTGDVHTDRDFRLAVFGLADI
jgi:hypothetical protein